jgi:hypothetical protein
VTLGGILAISKATHSVTRKSGTVAATFVGTLIIAIVYRKKPTSDFIYFCSRYFLNQKQHAKQHL